MLLGVSGSFAVCSSLRLGDRCVNNEPVDPLMAPRAAAKAWRRPSLNAYTAVELMKAVVPSSCLVSLTNALDGEYTITHLWPHHAPTQMSVVPECSRKRFRGSYTGTHPRHVRPSVYIINVMSKKKAVQKKKR